MKLIPKAFRTAALIYLAAAQLAGCSNNLVNKPTKFEAGFITQAKPLNGVPIDQITKLTFDLSLDCRDCRYSYYAEFFVAGRLDKTGLEQGVDGKYITEFSGKPGSDSTQYTLTLTYEPYGKPVTSDKPTSKSKPEQALAIEITTAGVRRIVPTNILQDTPTLRVATLIEGSGGGCNTPSELGGIRLLGINK